MGVMELAVATKSRGERGILADFGTIELIHSPVELLSLCSRPDKSSGMTWVNLSQIRRTDRSSGPNWLKRLAGIADASPTSDLPDRNFISYVTL
jgi:hypothetical protein